jgi:hypothetical protein
MCTSTSGCDSDLEYNGRDLLTDRLKVHIKNNAQRRSVDQCQAFNRHVLELDNELRCLVAIAHSDFVPNGV